MSFPADDAIQESPSKNKNTDLAQAAARAIRVNMTMSLTADYLKVFPV